MSEKELERAQRAVQPKPELWNLDNASKETVFAHSFLQHRARHWCTGTGSGTEVADLKGISLTGMLMRAFGMGIHADATLVTAAPAKLTQVDQAKMRYLFGDEMVRTTGADVGGPDASKAGGG